MKKLFKSKLKGDFMNFIADPFYANLCATVPLFLGGKCSSHYMNFNSYVYC